MREKTIIIICITIIVCISIICATLILTHNDDTINNTTNNTNNTTVNSTNNSTNITNNQTNNSTIKTKSTTKSKSSTSKSSSSSNSVEGNTIESRWDVGENEERINTKTDIYYRDKKTGQTVKRHLDSDGAYRYYPI